MPERLLLLSTWDHSFLMLAQDYVMLCGWPVYGVLNVFRGRVVLACGHVSVVDYVPVTFRMQSVVSVCTASWKTVLKVLSVLHDRATN